ncbi:MAG: addiction module protein [Planctomycetes bacterium]|nr:addiction module protein [Planctomycetota bacterium]
MHSVEELFEEAVSLPVEERLRLIDTLLETVRPKQNEIEKEWIRVARERREEILSGKVKPIPAKEVHEEIRKRFQK